MATFVSGLAVGTFGARSLAINVTGDISRSGTTVTLSNISCYLYASNGGTWYSATPRTWGLLAPDGSSVSTSVPYTPTASSRTFSLSNLSFYLANSSTSCTMYVTGPDGNFAFTLSGIPQGAVAPSGLSVSVSSVADTSASFSVSLSSYGTPSAADGRYIEAAILDTSTYGNPYRWNIARNTTSATIVVDDATASVSTSRLNVIGNRQYYYGAFASNTSLSISTVGGTFTTLPAYITDVTVDDQGQGVISFVVSHASEGSAATVTTEYSLDQSTWVAASDSFTLNLYSATTVYIRRISTAGSTPVYSVSVSPRVGIRLYGSVNGEATQIKKLYGSVGGESKRIKKLYGSVNGRSKLIYIDTSN